MKTRLFLFTLFLSILLLLLSLASVFSESTSLIRSQQIFYFGCLGLALALAMRFSDLVRFFSRDWYWLKLSHLIRFLALFAVYILSLLVAYKNPISMDWTKDKLFSLNEDESRILKQEPFKLILVANAEDHPLFYMNLKKFTESLKAELPYLLVELIDPIKSPSTAKALMLTRIPALVLESKTEKIALSEGDFFSHSAGRSLFLGPSALVAALAQIKNKQPLGLWAKNSLIWQEPSDQGFQILEFFLRQRGYLPFLCSLEEARHMTAPLILTGPELPLDLLKERQIKKLPTLILYEGELNSFDLPRIKPPLVLDMLRKPSQDPFFFCPLPTEHPASSLKEEDRLYLLNTRAIETERKNAILVSSQMSWAETSKEVEYNDSVDHKGPLVLAAETSPNQIWFAGKSIAENQFLVAGHNQTLILNCLHYLSGQYSWIQSKGREIRPRLIDSTHQENLNLYFLLIFFQPLCALAIACMIYFLRR